MPRVVNVDAETGEVVEGVAVLVAQRPKLNEPWWMGMMEGFAMLAKDPEMTGRSFRVLALLMSLPKYGNDLPLISQAEIARQLGMQPSNVTEAMKVLLRRGYVERVDRIGQMYAMRLSDKLLWRGSVRTLNSYRNDRAKKRLKLVQR